MRNFKDEQKDFLDNNKVIVNTILEQLKIIDEKNIKPGDYCAFGIEFILNGFNINSDFYTLADYISEFNENVYNHRIDLINHWDTYLYFAPTDYKGLIFDFSYLRNNKVITYNGLTNYFTSNEVIREFTIEDFLKEYGIKKFFSCSHYKVHWDNFGFSWNN